jgi:glycosyltransferase involved in cell wall biosynthesis
VRVLFLIRSLQPGGAERQVAELAKGLKAAGHHVSVVVLYPGGAFERELRATGVPTTSLDKTTRYGSLHVAARLLKIVRREKPALLYSVLTAANLLSLALRVRHRHVRLVWTIRASYVDFDEYDPWMRVASTLEKHLAELCDRIIVNSQAGFDHAVHGGYRPEKLVVVRNGIDTECFRRDPEGADRLRKNWQVASHEKLVGLVGRVDPMKDHRAFLAAAALLARRRADVRFVCVGDGPEAYWEEMRAVARRLGLGDRLRWAGLRSDMPAVYSALDALVLCSRGEGLPNVVAEAMACGTPCCVTDVGDAAWVVDGLGVVVGSSAEDVLADGMERVLVNPPDAPQREALRRRIVENLSVKRLIAETERVFQDLVREPSPPDRWNTERAVVE